MTDSGSRLGKVLVVDDEPDLLALLAEILRPVGYEVLVATNGDDAVMTAFVERPDVIVLDIRMPGVDGVEALRRIHALDPAIPIVMLSASSDEQIARDTLLIGASNYLPKPFDPDVLERIVAAALTHGPTRRLNRWSEKHEETVQR
jgi:DNA-binding response OmpR family regulator